MAALVVVVFHGLDETGIPVQLDEVHRRINDIAGMNAEIELAVVLYE